MDAVSAPITLKPGQHLQISSELPTVDGFHVQRLGDVYGAWVTVPVLSTYQLTGVENLDLDQFASVAAGPRWEAASDYLEARYGDTILDETLYDDGEVIAAVIGRDFDYAPSVREVVETLWATAHQVYGDIVTDSDAWAQELTAHLDALAFMPSNATPAPRDEVPMAVLLAATTGEPVDDNVASALVRKLATADNPSCYTTLNSRGYASREQLLDATEEVPSEQRESALALAAWATAQPITTRLLKQGVDAA